ncbi:MBL fold metallo-hydrolase [Mangrovicoccus algicola]|uniref:MBL fold metallo-hydrolase n=1 Tax=Mangrovicoccus algicola TaxID=2771008 RepID=A0A8J6Z9H0_9RHOB|nr:MBL fold metallo-hydrolase [Mangrovicoccus algicola]MBE3640509.1 MBL fold metallo-hydrolase [Mangrovicoccus algicola]
MKIGIFVWAGVASLSFAAAAASETGQPLAEGHRARGLAAARVFPGYASLCDLEAPMRNVNLPRVSRPARDGTARETRPSRLIEQLAPSDFPPVQVFDNLWFLGTPSVTAWLYGTAEGYLLIDGLNTDEEAQHYILDGMAALGLDPAGIKAVLVTHGHGDHYGGADYLADRLGIDVLMSRADWALVSALGDHPRFGAPPQAGGVVEDGDILDIGASKLAIHLTPGHTPGTVSPILELQDGSQRHVAMLWGGTGFNFGPDVRIFRQYAASARKMEEIARAAGVDVFLSNHPRRDATLEKLDALADRQAGEGHPFVSGEEGYALFTLLKECALAQAARFAGADGGG